MNPQQKTTLHIAAIVLVFAIILLACSSAGVITKCLITPALLGFLVVIEYCHGYYDGEERR